MAAFVPAAALPVTNRRARAVVSSRMGADGPAGRVSRAQFVRLFVGTAAAAAAAGVSGGVEPAHAGFGIGGLFSGGDSDNAVRGLDSSVRFLFAFFLFSLRAWEHGGGLPRSIGADVDTRSPRGADGWIGMGCCVPLCQLEAGSVAAGTGQVLTPSVACTLALEMVTPRPVRLPFPSPPCIPVF